MNVRLINLLLGEIQRQCTFALMDYEEMKESMKSMTPGNSEQLDRFWHSVPSFLVAVANISKILWPSTQKYKGHSSDVSTRAELRKLLNIDDSSVLKSTEFRNHFEHYDSRIEEWAKNANDGLIVDSNVVPSYLIAGYSKESVLRNFDPDTFELIFHDSKFKVKSVVNAIQNLLENTKQIISQVSSQ
jgi:hypothetical protein